MMEVWDDHRLLGFWNGNIQIPPRHDFVSMPAYKPRRILDPIPDTPSLNDRIPIVDCRTELMCFGRCIYWVLKVVGGIEHLDDMGGFRRTELDNDPRTASWAIQQAHGR